MSHGVVIAGGGLAAVRTAEALRDGGYAGRIVLLSDEPHLPYDRPPLSKDYLLGRADADAVRLLSAERLAELDVEVRLNAAVGGLDRAARRVRLAGGEEVAYERLVVATGARPARLALLDGFDNVLVLRSLDQAERLRAALAPAPSVAVVGGGFIGLEIAAVARRLGGDVTVIEATHAPLAPIIGGELGGCVQRFHERRGVQFWCGSAVTRALGRERVEALELGNGQRVPADLVVVGVGAIANSEWLADSGLELHRGLVCDQYGRTSDPHVFGAGDVVCRHIDGACRPTGHWTAAGDHARGVAALICGEDPMPIVEDNYFWSDQFDVRMQFVGVVPDAPRVTFVSGAPDEDAFVAICGGEHGGTAVFGVNSPRDFIRQSMPLRRGETLPVAA